MDALWVILVSALFGIVCIKVGFVCYKAGERGKQQIWNLYQLALEEKKQVFESWYVQSQENEILRKELAKFAEIPQGELIGDTYDPADYWKYGHEAPEWDENY